MKKAIATILACLLLFTLVACNKTDDTPAAPSPDGGASSAGDNGGSSGAAGKSSPWANADGSVNLNRVAHFDPDYDYTQNPRWKMIYINQNAPEQGSENINRGLEHWGSLMNIQYDGMVTANGDPDLFLTILQTQIDQGYKGLIIDPDALLTQSILDIMEDNPGVAWMTFNMPQRLFDSSRPDDPGVLVNPFVGFDFAYNGQKCGEGLLAWKEEFHPDVPWDRVGYIGLANAAIPVFGQIRSGSDQVMRDGPVPNENHFLADAAAYDGFTEAAQQAVAAIITTHDFDLWLISALIEPYALGAAVTTTTLGIDDTACIVSTSASALIPQWDAGVENAWRYAWYSEPIMMNEPIIGAVYAFLNGWATPETIWPQWVNVNDCGGPGHTYAFMMTPAVWFTQENYKDYLEWVDLYTETDNYPYDNSGITRDSFQSILPVPDYYKG